MNTLFLFIFESIGTSELILIGIIALIFLGPRKLPQIAKTIGKTMADFRNTTNEFKSTWQREVNFEEEERALKTGELPEKQVVRVDSLGRNVERSAVSAPEIREIDKAKFDDLTREMAENLEKKAEEEPEAIDDLCDKRSWL